MATIIIHRKKDWSLAAYNDVYEVILNGQRIGFLPSGETTEFDISPGQHKLRIKLGGYGSREHDFTLFNKETKSFTVYSVKNVAVFFSLFLVTFFEIMNHILKIPFSTYKNIFHIIIALCVLMVIYFQFFGRTGYIFLQSNK